MVLIYRRFCTVRQPIIDGVRLSLSIILSLREDERRNEIQAPLTYRERSLLQ